MAKVNVYIPEPTPEPTPVVVEQVKAFKDRTPCNWNIIATKSGIKANNSSSGEHFEGTMAEFNKLIRG